MVVSLLPHVEFTKWPLGRRIPPYKLGYKRFLAYKPNLQNIKLYFKLYSAGFGNGMTYISPMMFNESSIQRRQTARESTGPLKGWLQEHPRNPYPTKAEKVMLALISGNKNSLLLFFWVTLTRSIWPTFSGIIFFAEIHPTWPHGTPVWLSFTPILPSLTLNLSETYVKEWHWLKWAHGSQMLVADWKKKMVWKRILTNPLMIKVGKYLVHLSRVRILTITVLFKTFFRIGWPGYEWHGSNTKPYVNLYKPVSDPGTKKRSRTNWKVTKFTKCAKFRKIC